MPHYYPAITYGGPVFCVHYLCEALAKKRVSIQVSTTNANGNSKLDVPTAEPVYFAPHYCVRYYSGINPRRFSWEFIRNVWRDIRGSDVIHIHGIFSTSSAASLFFAWAFTKPVLLSPEGTLCKWGLTEIRPRLKKVWLSLFVRTFVRDAHRVAWHATAIAEKDEIIALFPNANVEIIPNGMDLLTFDRTTTPSRHDYLSRFFPECAIPAERVRILVGLGRLHAKKAFDVAIKAFHCVAQSHPETILLIAGGDDGKRAALETMVRDLGLMNRIALVGELRGENKIAFLKGADIFLFPSHSENFGMVCLEGLAAGIPVVASRNTPWAELEPAGIGFWVENTPEAFASAIAELLSKDLTCMTQKARVHAKRYDIGNIASSFLDVYLKLVSNR